MKMSLLAPGQSLKTTANIRRGWQVRAALQLPGRMGWDCSRVPRKWGILAAGQEEEGGKEEGWLVAECGWEALGQRTVHLETASLAGEVGEAEEEVEAGGEEEGLGWRSPVRKCSPKVLVEQVRGSKREGSCRAPSTRGRQQG